MLLLTTNKKPRYIIHSRGAQGHFNYLAYTAAGCITQIYLYFGRHGVWKAQNQRFHAPSRDMEEHLTVICPVTGYPTHFSCLVGPVTGQIDLAFFFFFNVMEFFCFSCCFHVSKCFKKKQKSWLGEWVGGV